MDFECELFKQIQVRNKEINWLTSETGRRICPIVTDVEKQKAKKTKQHNGAVCFFFPFGYAQKRKIPFWV